MKKFLLMADRLVIAAAAVGLSLRLWLLLVGPDEKGLYPAGHISWILLLVLTAIVAVSLFLLAGHAGHNRSYHSNFPASVPAAVGCVIGAVCVAWSSIGLLSGESLLHTLSGCTGLAAAAVLGYWGWCRWKNLRPKGIAFGILCLFFGVRIFLLGRTWGDDPELLRFFFGFLATVCAMLASYQLWGFAVNLGNRSAGVLFGLLSVYLCCCAIGENTDPILYAGLAVWMITNLCSLKCPPRAPRPMPEEKPEALPAEDASADSLTDAQLMEFLLSEDFSAPDGGEEEA